MDKNIIKKHLTERFLKEEDTPGISVTNAAKKESEKINKKAMKDVEKQSKEYSKSLGQDDANTSKMAQNKFNYTDEAEKTYHDEMEIMNGQEMIRYDRDPNKVYKERAKEAIEGSARMGNNPEWANVVPAQQGFTGPDFGKNLVKSIEASTKKRIEAEDNFTSLGDDIETIEGKRKTGPMVRGRYSALAEGKLGEAEIEKGKFTKWCEDHGFEGGPSISCAKEAMKEKHGADVHKMATFYMNTVKPQGKTAKDLEENNNNNKTKIKETMKNMLNEDKLVLSNYAKQLYYLFKKAGATPLIMLSGKNFASPDVKNHNVSIVVTINDELMVGIKGDKATATNYSNLVAKQFPDLQLKGDIRISQGWGGEQDSYASLVLVPKTTKKGGEVNPNQRPNAAQPAAQPVQESMKRLKFKNEFKGLGNALNLIPESYKVDNKVFEMTDGNETYKIRWEGSLTEGKAVVLTAADKSLMNEDITRMKQLFGYKSQDTLGLVKGKARIDENKVFGDIWNKTKTLLEGEDMDVTTSHAPEAKKHVEGSVATDKKTEASASEGYWEEVDTNAPEATEHVEGSVATDKKTEASASEGDLSDATSYAPEAKKHIMKEAVEDEDEDEGDDEKKDSWYKSDDDDDSSMEKEPTGGEMKAEVPSMDSDEDEEEEEVIIAPKKSDMSLMMSPSSGDYFIVDATGARTKVPAEYLEIASNKSLGTGAKRAEMIMAKMAEDSENM